MSQKYSDLDNFKNADIIKLIDPKAQVIPYISLKGDFYKYYLSSSKVITNYLNPYFQMKVFDYLNKYSDLMNTKHRTLITKDTRLFYENFINSFTKLLTKK